MPLPIRMPEPRRTYGEVRDALVLKNVHPRFVDAMLPELWAMATKYQLEPVGVVTQSGHETGWGAFTRAVKPEMHNTCGLKWHDSWRRQLVQLPEQGEHTLSHAAFPNWKAGADAQCQHILGYMGVELPSWQVITDPRYPLALAKAREVGGAVVWSDMKNGIWSTGATYGAAVEALMVKTFGVRAWPIRRKTGPRS